MELRQQKILQLNPTSSWFLQVRDSRFKTCIRTKANMYNNNINADLRLVATSFFHCLYSTFFGKSAWRGKLIQVFFTITFLYSDLSEIFGKIRRRHIQKCDRNILKKNTDLPKTSYKIQVKKHDINFS